MKGEAEWDYEGRVVLALAEADAALASERSRADRAEQEVEALKAQRDEALEALRELRAMTLRLSRVLPALELDPHVERADRLLASVEENPDG